MRKLTDNDYNKLNIGGTVYSVSLVVYLLVAFAFQLLLITISQNSGIAMSDMAVLPVVTFANCSVATVAIVLVILYKSRSNSVNIIKNVKYKKFDKKYWFVIVAGTLGLIFGLGNLNDYFIGLLGKIGYSASSITLPEFSVGYFICELIFVCLLPALSEETLFRGIVADALTEKGETCAILLGGALFSLFHMSPAQTVYQFLVGAFYTLVFIKSNSVLPTVIMHFANNVIVILMYYFIPEDSLSKTFSVISTVIGMALLVSVTLYLLIRDKREKMPYTKWTFDEFLPFIAGIAVSVAMWIGELAL